MLNHSPSRLEFVNAEYNNFNFDKKPTRNGKAIVAKNFPHV